MAQLPSVPKERKRPILWKSLPLWRLIILYDRCEKMFQDRLHGNISIKDTSFEVHYCSALFNQLFFLPRMRTDTSFVCLFLGNSGCICGHVFPCASLESSIYPLNFKTTDEVNRTPLSLALLTVAPSPKKSEFDFAWGAGRCCAQNTLSPLHPPPPHNSISNRVGSRENNGMVGFKTKIVFSLTKVFLKKLKMY